MITKYYQILDVKLALASDSRDLFHLFDLDYSWSRAASTGFNSNLNVSVILAPADKKPYVQNGKDRLSLDNNPQKVNFAYYYILRQLMQHIKEYFLLHAGVASQSGRTVMIAGPSGAGKTTLIIELLKKGFQYFSDDLCPVARKTGLVHPFPRSLWKVSEKNAKPAQQAFFIRPHKEPYFATDLCYKTANLPEKAGSLFFLTDGRPADNLIRLLIKGPGSLINHLRRLENVKIDKLKNNDDPQWSVIYPQGQGVTHKIDKVVGEHKDNLNSVFRVDPVLPDYNQAPELTEISTPEMAFRLMQQMQNMRTLSGQGNNPRPGLRVIELCELLEKVPCFLLKVGRLEAMVALILKNSQKQ